jgi:hypothetical protein
MRSLGRLVLACLILPALGACAAAPRAPAATLAAVGLTTTGTLSAEVQDVAEQLQTADAADTFARTWELCENAPVACAPSLSPIALSRQRNELADVVMLRARAVDQLGAAYSALQVEAASDGAADLQGAGAAAIGSANSFAAAAAALRGRGSAATVPGNIAALVDFGFGALGEHLQRRRILKGSREIANAVLKLRNGMSDEAFVFDSLADYLVGKRTAARLAMFDAGLISGETSLNALAEQLGVTLVGDAESIISNPGPARTALRATMEAMARQDVIAAQGRYRDAIAALDALLREHADLEQKRSVSIADVERLLDRLNASIDKAGATGGN